MERTEMRRLRVKGLIDEMERTLLIAVALFSAIGILIFLAA